MIWFAGDIRAVFWIAAIPAVLSFLFAWSMLRETARRMRAIRAKAAWGGFRDARRRPVKRLIAVGFLFGLARFSRRLPDPQGDGRRPVGDTGRRWCWRCSTCAFWLLAYPAGALSDRIAPRHVLLGGIALLVAADLWLALADGLVDDRARRGAVGRAHGADPGHFQPDDRRRRARAEQRATSFGAFFFASGIAALLASVGAGLLWDRGGPAATFTAGAGDRRAGRRDAVLLPKRA